MTLAELSEIWRKHDFSARKKALVNILERNEVERVSIDSIPIWEWEYQWK